MTGEVRCVHDAKATVGEGPAWSVAEQALYWSDITGFMFHRYDFRSGETKSWRVPEEIGSFALCEGGGFIAALRRGFAWIDPAAGKVKHLAGPRIARDDFRFNDGRCDRSGRYFLAGTMNIPGGDEKGVLYRIDGSADRAEVARGAGVSNGLAFSPDNRIMYWSDSRASTVWRFDFDPATGTASNQQVFVRTTEEQGRPDGACVDAAGFYWSACWNGGKVIRWSPEGRVDREIRLPATNITMPCFGGPDLKTLFVTSARQGRSAEQLAQEPLAGALFRMELDIPGLPETPFKAAPGLSAGALDWS
jgi:sugar lactone lactonase YvrE